MLYPVAGSRIFIADKPGLAPASVLATDWIEIGEVEAFGLLGGSWETIDGTHNRSTHSDGNLYRTPHKTILQGAAMQMVMGGDPADAGQILLHKAFLDRSGFYPFRILFPDPGVKRGWQAKVLGMSEVFDAANSLVKVQADMQSVGGILRSGMS